MDIKLKLKEASQAYYTGEPIMTDEEYDSMSDQFYKDHPDQYIVGYVPSKDRERKLPIPMFSLNKVSEISKVFDWLKSKINANHDDLELCLSPKYDGISVCVDEGSSPSLRSATTRGDGSTGQLCDMHYSFMNNGDEGVINQFVSFGEAIMSKRKFTKYDKSNGGMYKNARNLVGSQINSDKPTVSILKDIDYVRYGYGLGDTPECTTRGWQIEELNQLNSVQVPFKIVNAHEVTHELLMSLHKEWSKDYEIDGIVIDINKLSLASRLGREVNGNPAYARAYKGHFENSEITEVQSVTWQVSKHGKLKPVVNIEAVRLSGVDVTNPTGYNARYISEKGIGVGAIITVKRSGAVIPKIIEINNPSTPDIPDFCPSCGSQTRWDVNQVELMCVNIECPDMNMSKITAFFAILKCKEVGRGAIEAFYKAGFTTIKSVLEMTIGDMTLIDKYGIKKATKIHTEIGNCGNGVSMADLMHASGCFKDIGSDTIQLILDSQCSSEHDNLQYKNGETAFKEFLKEMYGLVNISGKDTAKTTKLIDLNVVFTGFRDTNLEKLIKENGGKVSNTVGKATSHLVMADIGSGTKKEEAAEKLGKVIMDGNQFREYLESKLV